MLTGTNSILKQATKAKEETKVNSWNEQKQLIILGAQFYHNKTDIITYLTDEFQKLDSTFIVTDVGSAFYIKSNDEQILYDYEFNEQEINEGNSELWQYIENSDGTLNIVGYNKALSGELILPNIIDGKFVKNINCNFKDNNDLTGIKVSYGIEYLGSTIFLNCKNISGEIDLPTSLKHIGYDAFRNCISIKKITGLNNVKFIDNNAFLDCSNLVYISELDNIERIGSFAFGGCTSLKNITLGNKIENLGYAVFNQCTSLESITFGNSIKSIGYEVFSGCNALNKVYYNGTLEQYKNISFAHSNSYPTNYTDGYIYINGTLTKIN